MDFVRKSRQKTQKLDGTLNHTKDSDKKCKAIPTKIKFPLLSLRNKTVSSGLGSSENYSIESGTSSNPTTQNDQTSISNKRPMKSCDPIFDKKIKLKEHHSNNNIDETGLGMFQDTLENLDITTILKNSVSKTPQNEQLNKTEFDAFTNFLNNGSTESNKVQNVSCKLISLKTDQKELFPTQDDVFSQSFNTQMINQIDVVLNAEENKSNTIECENDDENCNKTTVNNNQEKVKGVFKLPIQKSFTEKMSVIKARQDKQIQDRSLLFHNESVTTQYKKDVDNLFEEIEHSICAMGTENPKKIVPDKILDVIFAEDTKSPSKVNMDPAKFQEELSRSLANIEWNDESFFNSANCSFGSVIKQALLNNATKSMQQQIEKTKFDCTLNLSLAEKQADFHCLGPFYGLPDKVKELIKQYKGIDNLYDWQDECLKLAIANRKNLIYALPTSGGKTLVAEILMLREVMCYQQNALFILPYVAIVQEKVWDFSPFGVALDFLVEEYASSKGTYPPRKRRRKHSVYIATIEKALGLINSLIETGRLHELGLIVIDELHLIGEEGRGATLEGCLAKIMFLKANIQIVGMSATIGNIQDICKFLNAEVYTKDFRPVELTEYVKCGNEIARINWKCKDQDDLLNDVKKLDYKYSEAVSKLDPDMLGGLALEVVPTDSCLVFCQSKKNCENVVYLLCKLAKPDLKIHKKVEKDQLLHALKGEAGELCDILKVSVPFGIAYHHSGLTNDERRLLEDAFRAGTISVICCTSTLAAGVNLPARRVILRSPYVGKDFINLSRYKQMAGRAGRAGLGETGESIIITQPIDLPKVKQLLMSPMNQAMSSLHALEGRGLRHLLLSCISLGVANTRTLLQLVTKSTLMAVQMEKLDVDIKKLTDTVIKNLFKLGALQESCAMLKESSSAICDMSVRMDTSMANLTSSDMENDSENLNKLGKKPKKTVVLTSNTKLVVSNLGSAAIRGGLELSRAHQLYDDLYNAQKSLVLLDCLHLLYLVTPYDTSEQIRPNMQVYYEVLTKLGEKEKQTACILGFDEAVTVKMIQGVAAKQVPEKVLHRFYVTLMLYDLWNEMPVFKASEKYQTNRGIVQNLMTISATFASNVVNFCEQLEEFWAFSYLLKGMTQRLSHCCMKELLPLMELPAVKQSRAKQLYNAGYKNLQSIAKANVNDLVESIEYMSRRTANQLIAASKMLLLEKVENLREEAEDVLDGVENPRQLFNMTLLPLGR